MSREGSPWTWAKALREHGPNDRDFRCALWCLRTWMDKDGFAYPSLRTWATGVPMSVNTLRKHVAAAVAAGWLHVEARAGQRRQRVRNVYRCTIPDHVCIDGDDDKIAEAIAGDVDESLSGSLTERVGQATVRKPFEAPSKGLADAHAVSHMPDTDATARPASVSPHADTDQRTAAPTHSQPVDESPSVSNPTPICVKAASDLCQKWGSSVSTHADTEVLSSKKEALEGAAAAARTRRPENDVRPEDDQTRRQKARKHLEAAPTTDDARIASMYRLTLDQVRSVRAELAEAT